MADIRQQYLQDHAAMLARQQALAHGPGMLSSVGNGIMSLFGGTSPYAVGPAQTGPQAATDNANSPVITHNVADDPTKSPVSQPDTSTAGMDKSNASMHDVQANPMTAVPTLGAYIPPDHTAALNDQTMPANTPSGGLMSLTRDPMTHGAALDGPVGQVNYTAPDVITPTVAGRSAPPVAAARTGNLTDAGIAAAGAVKAGLAGIGSSQGGTSGRQMNAPTTTIGQGLSDATSGIGPALSAAGTWLAGSPMAHPFDGMSQPIPTAGGPAGGVKTGGPQPGGPGGGTQTGQSLFGPGGAPPEPMPAPTTTAATVDPNQQAIADIMQQKALINAIYPERPVDTSSQDRADAELEKDRSRSSSEAMLALMAGIAQGSGGIWAGVGKGLAGAGQAYEQGFSRYQKALQNKADRSKSDADQHYNDQVGRSDAAVKLYAQQQTLTKDANTLARQQFKDTQEEIDKRFTEMLRTQKGTDLNPPDEAAIARTMHLWDLSTANHKFITSEDDLTK